MMKYVVFAPYWNVPYSIVKNEMGRTAAYFNKRNMEIVGRYKDGLPMVRQKPGPGNSLGKVKFLFPNSYSIYLHDTPSKSLFGQNTRAFSHGCIRVSDPPKLAHWVLRFNPEWSYEKIEEGFNYTKETTVTIAKPIPVFIGYFTCWVDQNGKLNFRKDIYGRDKKLADHLFPAGK
jgi:murein L,D-transpeptidase YcbB/YkuD